MFFNKKEEQLHELEKNDLLSAMLQAIPGQTPPSEPLVAFDRRKEELISKLTADIALDANRQK